MANIICGTSFVSEDEACLGLYEINLQSPGSKGFHRYQILYVMRGDRPAQLRHDMGPAKHFRADQIRIPGGFYDEDTDRYYVEHTVGELRQIADYVREHPAFEPADLPNLERDQLIPRWLDQLDQKNRLRIGKKVYGNSTRN